MYTRDSSMNETNQRLIDGFLYWMMTDGDVCSRIV